MMMPGPFDDITVLSLLARLARGGGQVHLPRNADAGLHSATGIGANPGASPGAGEARSDDDRDLPPELAQFADRIAACLAAGHVRIDARGCCEITSAGRAALRRSRARQAEQAAVAAVPDAAAAAPQAREAPQINDRESPLAWLRRRFDKDGQPLITAEQFDAGERLRTDLWQAQLTPRVTQSWSMTGAPSGRRAAPGAGYEMSDRLVAARVRVERALGAVGPELADILIDVCGHLRGLEEIERSEAWPQRSAKLILIKALTALARHYGLLPTVDAQASLQRRLQHWGTPDYRPTLDRWR